MSAGPSKLAVTQVRSPRAGLYGSTMFWTTLLTGGFTLAGALGGVYLTQRHARETAREARAAARKDELRRDIAELRPAAAALISTYEVVPLFMARAESSDINEWAHSETVARLNELFGQVRRHITRVAVTPTSPELTDAVTKLRDALDQLGEVCSQRVRDAKDAGEDTIPIVGRALAYLRHVAALNAAVETAAAAEFAVLDAPPPSWLDRARARPNRENDR